MHTLAGRSRARSRFVLLRAIACVVAAASLLLAGRPVAAAAAAPATKGPTRSAVLATADRAFRYYSGVYDRLGFRRDTGWIWGTYEQGVLDLQRVTAGASYLQDVVSWAARNGDAPRTAVSNADNTKAITVLYDLHATVPSVPLAATNRAMAGLLATVPSGNYSWIDALFMGMGNWPRAAGSTGNARYLDTMDALYASTRDRACGTVGMFNPADGLWYRDCGFVGKTDTNGQPVYWSRGNGWVMGALAETLQALPANSPRRGPYTAMLRTMAAALAPLQGSDGMWRPSLRDPALFPQPETSGTALITYALAYGVWSGVLDRSTYLPVVTRAWQGLSTVAVRPSGFVSFCQPPDNQPHAPYTGTGPRVAPTARSAGTLFSDSTAYCVGAVLLAASTVAPLLDPHPARWGDPQPPHPRGGWGGLGRRPAAVQSRARPVWR